MLKAIEAYLALRRVTGFAMLNAEYLLKSFAAFATERGQTHVHTQTAIDWAARGPSVAQRDARLKAVCSFVRHVRVEDARHELPPVDHFGARTTRRPPHIYSAAQIDRLIEVALRLRPKRGLRSITYATLIALLSVTGLRISEDRAPHTTHRNSSATAILGPPSPGLPHHASPPAARRRSRQQHEQQPGGAETKAVTTAQTTGDNGGHSGTQRHV